MAIYQERSRIETSSRRHDRGGRDCQDLDYPTRFIRLDCGNVAGCTAGNAGRAAIGLAPTRQPERRWRDLAQREHLVELVYAPCRVRCPRCRPRVERVPWADKWQRVTHALARAVAALPRELTWSAVAHHFRLNWKTIAVVEGVVLWGLQHRRWEPPHVIGIDEVSRRKGQHCLTIVYDLSRGRVVWVGHDSRAPASIKQSLPCQLRDRGVDRSNTRRRGRRRRAWRQLSPPRPARPPH
jgi:Helix-turn-helix domain of transposase family ISL3